MIIHARAAAKVNICLEVLGRREDGYHEVATILQAITLADDLFVETDTSLSFVCDHPGLDGPANMVLRAAEALRSRTRVGQGARLRLVKNVPVAAGLGGGSADAAATLVALDRLWRTGLSPGDLLHLAVGLGADVPFFLGDVGTALGEGRGDRIKALGVIPRAWIVIVVPSVPVPDRKTAALYALLRPEHYTDGARARAWAAGLQAEPLWSRLLLDPGVFNAFDAVAEQAYPGIGAPWDVFRQIATPTSVQLSGAGPALFALFPGPTEARAAHRKLAERGLRAILAETAAQPVTLLEE